MYSASPANWGILMLAAVMGTFSHCQMNQLSRNNHRSDFWLLYIHYYLQMLFIYFYLMTQYIIKIYYEKAHYTKFNDPLKQLDSLTKSIGHLLFIYCSQFIGKLKKLSGILAHFISPLILCNLRISLKNYAHKRAILNMQ